MDQNTTAKKRKTLDEYLGTTGILIIAVIGTITRISIILPIAMACGLVGLYYLIKKRKELSKKQKIIGWILFVVWLVCVGIFL